MRISKIKVQYIDALDVIIILYTEIDLIIYNFVENIKVYKNDKQNILLTESIRTREKI